MFRVFGGVGTPEMTPRRILKDQRIPTMIIRGRRPRGFLSNPREEPPLPLFALISRQKRFFLSCRNYMVGYFLLGNFFFENGNSFCLSKSVLTAGSRENSEEAWS
jgi:hypothetical protein